MRIGRVSTPKGVRFVRADGTRMVPIENPFDAFAEGRDPRDVGEHLEGEMIAPSAPIVVVGIAQNGPGHDSPVQAWLKSPRTVVASGTTVVLRRDAGTTVAEGEIALVIGRPTSGLTAQNAHEYVLGVTAVNDLSSPDRATWDPRNFESKSGEGYTPLGPWIETVFTLEDIALVLRVDGVERASTNAHEMPVPLRECLAYVAGWTPLSRGDVIMTGAPFSSAPIEPGAHVEVGVAGVTLVMPTI